MKQGQFENEIFIQAQPEKLIRFLTDHHNHSRFHPLIVAVREVDPPPGVMRRFFLTDQLVWGPFRFKIVYRADVLRATGDEMLTEAVQSPNMHVTNHSTFTAEAGGTRLHETITVRCPDLLFGYAFSQAKAAHERLLQELKALVEANPL